MNMLWATASYLINRISSAREASAERGALSLEWILIAVALVGIVAAAAAVFRNSIQNLVSQLP